MMHSKYCDSIVNFVTFETNDLKLIQHDNVNICVIFVHKIYFCFHLLLVIIRGYGISNSLSLFNGNKYIYICTCIVFVHN